MIVTQYLEQEQERRELEGLNAHEAEADRNTDLHSAGELDAVIGAEPDPILTANELYRRGYDESFWQFYYKKYAIQIATEF